MCMNISTHSKLADIFKGISRKKSPCKRIGFATDCLCSGHPVVGGKFASTLTKGGGSILSLLLYFDGKTC